MQRGVSFLSHLLKIYTHLFKLKSEPKIGKSNPGQKYSLYMAVYTSVGLEEPTHLTVTGESLEITVTY